MRFSQKSLKPILASVGITTVDTKCNSLSYRILRKGNRCPNFHGRFAGHFHMATSIWTNKEKEIVGGRRVVNASRI